MKPIGVCLVPTICMYSKHTCTYVHTYICTVPDALKCSQPVVWVWVGVGVFVSVGAVCSCVLVWLCMAVYAYVVIDLH